MKFKVFILSLILIFIPICAFAETNYSTKTIENIETQSNNSASTATNSENESQHKSVSEQMGESTADVPYVTTDDVLNKINEKGSQATSIFQSVGIYITGAMFIIMLIAFIFNKKAGISILICLIAYICIKFGPELLNLFAGWMLS